MANYSNSESSEQSAFGLFLMVMIAVIGIVVLYQKFQLEINTMLGWVIQGQVAPFMAFMERPRKIFAWFDKVNLGEQSFDTMMILMRAAGSYFRWICLPIFVGLLFRGVFEGSVWRYCYTMTAERLIEENSHFMPCLRPIVGKKLHEEDIDHGPWRTARQALQFAVENRLLMVERDGTQTPIDSDLPPGKKGFVIGRNGIPREDSPCLLGRDAGVTRENTLHFTAQRALEIFKEQLGAGFEGADSLPPHALGLAAAFMVFGQGDKGACQVLLDHMSTTFTEHTTEDGTLSYTVDIGNARNVFEQYIEHEDVESIRMKHGSYVSTFLMALFDYAKKKGVLASSQFIWLRPYDRTLWYTLNQVGGKAAWAEGAGPWAHYLFEEKLGETVLEPQCAEATTALRYVLEQEGWLPPVVTQRKKFAAAPAEASPQFTRNRDGLGDRKLVRGGKK